MDEKQTSQLFELAGLILAVGRHIQASKEAAAESGTPLQGAVTRFIDRHPGATGPTKAVYRNAPRPHRDYGGAQVVGGAETPWYPSQADVLLACDFFETVTLSGARLHVLAVIEHTSRRIRILGATAHPTASWVAQAAKNLVMDLEDAGCRARYMIRDRDRKFPALFGALLKDAGIQVVLSGVRIPRMNSSSPPSPARCATPTP